MMATATKGKKTKGGKAKGGSRGKRVNVTPALKCPFVIDLRRPYSTDASVKLAAIYNKTAAAIEDWKSEVKAHYAGGGKPSDCPEFDAYPTEKSVNGLMMTEAAFDKMLDSDEGCPFPRYNPILIQLASLLNATCLQSSIKQKNPPKNWDEAKYGSWWIEYEEEGETIQEPSGWKFVEKPRGSHANTVEELVTEPETHIITVGSNRYVVGGGTLPTAAIFQMNGFKSGNFRAGDVVRRRMSVANDKRFTDLIFKIEDKPNNGEAYVMKVNGGEVTEVVFLPGQVVTAGYLHKGGKALSCKDIRKLDAAKGTSFKAVKAGELVGKEVTFDDMWPEIQSSDRKAIKAMRERGGRSEEYEAGDTKTKTRTNLGTTARTNFRQSTPFAVRCVQLNVVACTHSLGGGEFAMFVAVDRSSVNHNITVTAEAEEEAAPKATKKKATSKKGKTETTEEAAAPIEADTATEEVTETVDA